MISEKEKWDNFYLQQVQNESAPINEQVWGLTLELTGIVKSLLKDGGRILEAGCGSGAQSLKLAQSKKFDISLLDFSLNALANAKSLYKSNNAKATFLEGDLFESGESEFDLVYNFGVLEHYTLQEQVAALKAMGSRSRQFVAVAVPNKACYWYWLWRTMATAKGEWPYGKEVPVVGMKEMFDKAGLKYLGQKYVGADWTESYISSIEEIPNEVKQSLTDIHRANIIPASQKSYLIFAIAAVNDKVEFNSQGWLKQENDEPFSAAEQTAMLSENMATLISLQRQLAQQKSSEQQLLSNHKAEIETVQATLTETLEKQEAILSENQKRLSQEQKARETAEAEKTAVLSENMASLISLQKQLAQQKSSEQQQLSSHKAEIETVQATLTEKIEKQEAILSENQRRLSQEQKARETAEAEKTAMLSENMASLISLQKQLAQQKSSEQQQLSSHKAELETVQATLTKKIEKQEAILSENRKKLSQEQKKREKAEAELKKNKAKLAADTEVVTLLKSQLADKKNDLKRERQSASRIKRSLQEGADIWGQEVKKNELLVKKLATMGKTLKRKTKDHEALKIMHSETEASQLQLKHDSQVLNGRTFEAETALSQLRHHNQVLNDRAYEAETALSQLKQDCEELQMRLVSAEQMRNHLEFQTNAFESSTSWKVTKPLRASSDLGRYVLGKDGQLKKDAPALLQTFQGEGLLRTSEKVVSRLKNFGVPSSNKVNNSVQSSGVPQLTALSTMTHEEFTAFFRSELEKGTPVFVGMPTIAWDVPLFQRPQHMATAMSNQGALVIYNHLDFAGQANNYEEIVPGVWLTADPRFYEIAERAICSVYSTAYATDLDQVRAMSEKNIIAYEYIDHIDEAISGDNIEALQTMKNYSFQGGADLILPSAKVLEQEVIESVGADKSCLVPNGVDHKHYINSLKNPGPVTADYEAFCHRYDGKVVGYFGALAPWLWYEMINELVEQRSDLGFVFIGPDYFGGAAQLVERENLFAPGPINYKDLPNYGRYFNVATIPFRPGEIARTTSPLKLFEYFALETPVVVTDGMEECTVYDEVFRGKDTVEFSKMIDAALAKSNSRLFKRRLRNLALKNTWNNRAKDMLEAGQKALQKKFDI